MENKDNQKFEKKELDSIEIKQDQTDTIMSKNSDSYRLLLSNIVPPLDYWHLAYFIMFYEGIGNLFPWNAFITASNYYAQRFCGTSFETDFENFFSIAYTLSQTIGLALSVVYQDRMRLNDKIIWPLFFYSLLFLLTTILVTVDSIDANLLFWVTMISTCLCGLCGAILSGGLFGLGAMFPPVYTGALMNGQGVAGLVVSVSGLLTQLAADPIDDCDDDGGAEDDDGCEQSISFSALAYFIIATLILLSCVVAYVTLIQLPFTKFFISRAAGEVPDLGAEAVNPFFMNDDNDPDEDTLLKNNTMNSNTTDENFSKKNTIDSEELNKKDSTGSTGLHPTHLDPNTSTDVAIKEFLAQADAPAGEPLTTRKLMQILREVQVPSFSVFFTFMVTIGLFPSIIVLIESTEKCSSSDRFYNDLFTPFFFLLFNVFDLCGRVTAGATRPVFTPKTIWIASLVRVIFAPLFLLCKISDSQLTTLFNNDAFPILFMILMSFTNGYVASCSMMMGASICEAKDSAIAGNIMIFSLTLGLFAGACFSFLFVFIAVGTF